MTNEPDLDTEAARRVHFVDPRVRQLAYARYQLALGGGFMSWLALGKDHPDAGIWEARDWLRAAVAAGLMPIKAAPQTTPPADPASVPAGSALAQLAQTWLDRAAATEATLETSDISGASAVVLRTRIDLHTTVARELQELMDGAADAEHTAAAFAFGLEADRG